MIGSLGKVFAPKLAVAGPRKGDARAVFADVAPMLRMIRGLPDEIDGPLDDQA